LLQAIGDPLARGVANAPIDDAPTSAEEMRAVEASSEWLKDHEPISHEQALADFALAFEDFERMSRPLLTFTAKASNDGKEDRRSDADFHDARKLVSTTTDLESKLRELQTYLGSSAATWAIVAKSEFHS